MRRTLVAMLAAAAVAVAFTAPVGAKSFDSLYAEGEAFRTFGTPARVDPGTGTDPIYTFTNSTSPDQLSVAEFAPGEGSHGGRWAVYHVTWTDAGDPSTVVTSFDQLMELVASSEIDDPVRDEAADFRCPILPND